MWPEIDVMTEEKLERDEGLLGGMEKPRNVVVSRKKLEDARERILP